METREEQKPLLLIFPFGLLSHYLRCLMLAKHFRDHFRVLFAYDERYADFCRERRFPNIQLFIA